jgi:hypothetical protein
MTNEKISPELRTAVLRTLYHHPRSSPAIVQLLTREVFETPPPKPTEDEKRMAHDTVEELIGIHYNAFREACLEVIGEDPLPDTYL